MEDILRKVFDVLLPVHSFTNSIPVRYWYVFGSVPTFVCSDATGAMKELIHLLIAYKDVLHVSYLRPLSWISRLSLRSPVLSVQTMGSRELTWKRRRDTLCEHSSSLTSRSPARPDFRLYLLREIRKTHTTNIVCIVLCATETPKSWLWRTRDLKYEGVHLGREYLIALTREDCFEPWCFQIWTLASGFDNLIWINSVISGVCLHAFGFPVFLDG